MTGAGQGAAAAPLERAPDSTLGEAMLATFAKVMLKDEIRLAAERHVPVLVTAEDSDQRAMCARVIHAGWDGGRGPFVSFCAARASTPPGCPEVAPLRREPGNADDILLRSAFERARGGTLFIDDVAALTDDGQATLFTLLDELLDSWSAVPRGKAAVRIVAGASHHLDAERARGVFRDSLFYRLNVIHFDFLAPPALG
jgi:DNA-binding NtrC family response regulator